MEMASTLVKSVFWLLYNTLLTYIIKLHHTRPSNSTSYMYPAIVHTYSFMYYTYSNISISNLITHEWV